MIMVFFFLYQFGGMMKNNDMSFFSESLTNGYSVSSIINTVGVLQFLKELKNNKPEYTEKYQQIHTQTEKIKKYRKNVNFARKLFSIRREKAL